MNGIRFLGMIMKKNNGVLDFEYLDLVILAYYGPFGAFRQGATAP